MLFFSSEYPFALASVLAAFFLSKSSPSSHRSRGGDTYPTMTQFPTPPITSANFAVPPFPLPRAWDRIPVPPSAPRLLQNLCTSKIWKRVAVGAGGVTSLSRADEQYEAAVAELRSRGNRPRKRSRYHGFVPLWTTTSWDSRVDAMRDGKWDLFEARGGNPVFCVLPRTMRWTLGTNYCFYSFNCVPAALQCGLRRQFNHTTMGATEETQHALANRPSQEADSIVGRVPTID